MSNQISEVYQCSELIAILCSSMYSATFVGSLALGLSSETTLVYIYALTGTIFITLFSIVIYYVLGLVDGCEKHYKKLFVIKMIISHIFLIIASVLAQQKLMTRKLGSEDLFNLMQIIGTICVIIYTIGAVLFF